MTNLPSIDFCKIRTHEGSQNSGFEELCVQLFRHEFNEPFFVTRIQGRGGDGGVEAYAKDPNDLNKIIGLQAKFFNKLETTQWTQIEKSVQSAKKNYLNLSKYIIAVPLNKTPNQIDTWNSKIATWNTGRDIPIEFIWWGASEIMGFLNQKCHHGRLQYWFGIPEFNVNWIQSKFQAALMNLDHRYTPDFHIKTETEKRLDVFVGKDSYQKEFNEYKLGIQQNWDDFRIACERQKIFNEIYDINEKYNFLAENFISEQSISSILALIPFLNDLVIQIDDIQEKQNLFEDLTKKYFEKFKQTTKKFLYICRQYLPYKYQNMLLLGEAGSGKSHLLANVVQSIINDKKIGILLVGEIFTNDNNVSDAILSLLDLNDFTMQHFLSFLNVASETTGYPALICIDAINESNHRHIWKKTLLNFTNTLSEYKNIKFIISCRNDFKDICVPDQIFNGCNKDWTIYEHFGFQEDQFHAITTYFNAYNVQSDHFPPVYSEFRNPLFLKTFCEAFSGQRVRAESYSLSQVMDKLIEKISTQLSRNINYPKDKTIQAIDIISDEMIKTNTYLLSARDIASELDEPPWNTDSNSIYRHLKSSRLISEVGGKTEDDIKIRFSYEKYSDFFFAKELIKNQNNLITWIESVKYPSSGILTALFSIYPEVNKGNELFDILPDELQNDEYFIDSYFKALQWRNSDSFTENSEKIFKKLYNKLPGDNKKIEVLLPLATIPNHPFNAIFLNNILEKQELWQRDMSWTSHINYLVNEDDNHGLYSFLKWTTAIAEQHIFEDQVELVSILLIWCLTSTVWQFRDDVTKVLIILLQKYPDTLVSLIKRFHQVNDPYVKERLYAVAAGVVMRIHDKTKIAAIAEVVYQNCFNQKEVEPHILLRDYANTIMETALYKQALPEDCVPEKFRPPYHSKWPENLWTETQINEYEKKEAYYHLIWSIRPEGNGKLYGDFGRYVMGGRLNFFTKHHIDEDVLFPKGYLGKDHRFNHTIGQAFILQRVLELGWLPERFAEKKYSYDRDRPYRERISKKYQWIALHELLGLVSDNFHMCSDYGSKKENFQGAWQINIRDFDPSFFELSWQKENFQNINTPKFMEQWNEYPNPIPNIQDNKYEKKEDWVFDQQIPSPNGLINPKAHSNQMLLSGYFRWQEKTQYSSNKEQKFDMWIHIRSYLIDESVYQAYTPSLKKQNFYGNGIVLPEIHGYWIGEYPWRRFIDHYDNFYDRHWLKINNIPAEITTFEYCNENATPSIFKLIPSPSVLKLTDLFWGGANFDFINTNGATEVFNPSLYNNFLEDLCVINKDYLINKLKEKKKKIFWVIVGEKRLIGGERENYVGHLTFSGVYELLDNRLTGNITCTEAIKPGKNILAETVEDLFLDNNYLNFKDIKKNLTEMKIPYSTKIDIPDWILDLSNLKNLADLANKKVQMTHSTLKSYLHSLTKKKYSYSAGKGWYSSIEEEFQLNTSPVKEIANLLITHFSLLSFSCWSTEQLKLFTHQLLTKFIVFLYVEKDYIRNIAITLKENGCKVYENPTKLEIDKQFSVEEKTVIIRPSISKQPKNNEFFSPIEKILVDFLIENQKFMIMDHAEAENLFRTIINSGRINMASLFSYAARRKLVLPALINQVQNNIKAELVDL